MHIFATPQEAKSWREKLNEVTLGLIPTMGALHQGHASLVKKSLSDNDMTIVSIFVNPLQFNNEDDLKSYPSTFKEDCALLESLGVNAVFTGKLDDFFPNGAQLEDAGDFSKGLEGAHRPGHFEGVRAIVKALFNFIQPDIAYFGQKDLQQTLVIKSLSKDLGFPQISVAPTVRDEHGLALSSRNTRLSDGGIKQARHIYRALNLARDLFQRGERNAAQIENAMSDYLRQSEFEIDYCAVRNGTQWSEASPENLNNDAYALIAAYVEGVRLIDNIKL